MKQIRNIFGIVILTVLSACSGNGSSASGNNNNSSGNSSLSVVAPDQYPAGVTTTAYLTITNQSDTVASNLIYGIASNSTGDNNIHINDASSEKCRNIPAQSSCVLQVAIESSSHPGSFAIAATSTAQNQTATAKLKSLIGLDAPQYLLKANVGLTTLPTNSQAGANGISFLYSPTVVPESNGVTLLSVVAVVNQNAGNNFNTINLTTKSGALLDFSVLSGNSGNGLTNLVPGAIVTFVLRIPSGASSPYQFYAQTMENDSLVSQGTDSQSVNIASTTKGILVVQPSGFNLTGNYTAQVITYTNTGNGTINGLSIAEPQSPISITANDCISALEPGRSCIVVVSSNAGIGTNGSGTITASYDNGSSVLSQYNYSGATPSPTPTHEPAPVPQAGIALSAVNNFVFSATTTQSATATQVTLQNSGNTNETNFNFSFVPNQYFAISKGIGDTCDVSASVVTTTLTSGSSCTFTLTYTNAAVGVGLTQMNIGYNYNGSATASTSKTLAYQTSQAGSTLSVTPAYYNFGAIVADNSDSKSTNFTIRNDGAEAITAISFQSITGDSGYFTVNSSGGSGCAAALPLANGATCTFSVTFGPTASVKANVSATLPIDYSFAGGSSSTSVDLSGYARSPQAANIQLYNVTASTSTGNGESQNSAYQFESTIATTGTITLRYKNTSVTNATNFTITNPPTGYAVDNSSTCGAGNMVTLLANGANNCQVILKPLASTVGALNVALTNASLSGSWTDEQGSISAQTILWNTGNGTQNTIYANIYAAAAVSAVMSSDSAGTSPITQLQTDQSFYIVFTLTGGYNVNTTYTVTTPAGFTPTTNSCSVTSVAPQCSVAFTAPSSASTANNITIATSGGGVTPTPTSFNVNVVLPTTYAYIAVYTPGVMQCTVSNDDGTLTNCATAAKPVGATLDMRSTTVDPAGNYLYVLTNDNAGAGTYYACALGTTGQYDRTKCGQKDFPAYGNIAFAATGNDVFAYLAGLPSGLTNGNNPNYCTIYQESSLFCNVASSVTAASNDVTNIIVGDTSYVYVSGANVNNNSVKISVCDVTTSAGYGNCSPAYTSMSITNPTSLSAIKIGSDYYVYLLDYQSQVTYCKISTTGVDKGKFSSCNTVDSADIDVSSANSIATATVGGQAYLYVTNPNSYSITVCSLNPTDTINGGVYSCYDSGASFQIGGSNPPYGLSFGSF